ncbi:hypothetical protein BT69DRAFT_1340928 [Atractiella rhizophila]|nr:hypothetical protein BT69DRAFT_1340928 [Atractiella rhizophila]
MTTVFQIFVRESEFTLSKTQIMFDSPNFFTRAFFGEFEEANSRSVRIDAHPQLFKIVIDYLSGYDVFPIADTAIPSTMSKDTALKNLMKDAAFLDLDRFTQLLQEEVGKLQAANSSILSKPHVLALAGSPRSPADITDLALNLRSLGVLPRQRIYRFSNVRCVFKLIQDQSFDIRMSWTGDGWLNSASGYNPTLRKSDLTYVRLCQPFQQVVSTTMEQLLEQHGGTVDLIASTLVVEASAVQGDKLGVTRVIGLKGYLTGFVLQSFLEHLEDETNYQHDAEQHLTSVRS